MKAEPAAPQRRLDLRWSGRRSMPMFLRVFVAMVATIIVSAWVFGSNFGAYQDRATASTLAPLWAEAIRAATPPAAGERTRRKVQIEVEVLGGEPPERAVELTNDGRMAALGRALAERGIAVQQVRLDDTTDPPVTWLRIDQGGGVSRWTGIVGGLQPSEYRRRLLLALGGLAGVVLVVAALMSRWVAAPVSRLVRQIDGIARGELPESRVRGAREIERLGDALRSMASRRNEADEQQRAMLLGVSHDLRSPLARIRVAADLLEGESTRLRELIVANVVEADSIIESFLTYTRADAEVRREPVDLAAVARVAAELAQLPPAQVAASAPVEVRGDATLLQRVAANLIDNALRHGEPPVTVAVRADRAAGVAELAVGDAGRGLDDPERLRRPFERGDPARGRHGAGLGLAIVDRIVERHGGSVAFERFAAGGAVVRVRLPLA
jgi:two-component system osmolarity sensor histidine kinase EnvZ